MMTSPSYELLDIEARQQMWPSTIFIPSATQRMSILPGDRVKLIFLRKDEPVGVTSWINVTTSPHDRPRCFHGQVVESVPNLLTVGDHVNFEPRHVADIIHARSRFSKTT